MNPWHEYDRLDFKIVPIFITNKILTLRFCRPVMMFSRLKENFELGLCWSHVGRTGKSCNCGAYTDASKMAMRTSSLVRILGPCTDFHWRINKPYMLLSP